MFSNHSEIVTAENTEAIRQAMTKNVLDPKKTIILVDIDLNLIYRGEHLIASDFYPAERKKFLDELAAKDPKLVEEFYKQTPYLVTDPELPKLINELQNQGYTVLGFTSRRTGKAKEECETTVQQDLCISLEKLGICFSDIEDYEIEPQPHWKVLQNPNLQDYEKLGKPQIFGKAYKASTIFTANYIKADVVKSIIDHLNKKGLINTVIHLDDNRSYLKDMKKTCKDVNFLGIHNTYPAKQKQRLPLDLGVVEYQKNCLIENGNIPTDTEAGEVLSVRRAEFSGLFI